ncbi:c2h2 finger domain containing protein [Ophiostoma piceae UAMH 11346]|uniref:C2h2 finger domain containing protein n=1 Tax=Ophiostoma piceae (strain UAMH 11346) TaxID=1262450 RepID=S3BWF3_OPHP1|nr:c2h2 finger domain containing protein [Ophiostoma piceae UAMH 11346]
MPPTASAREAMRSFFCELCQKGYSRMNEYEAHLSSYDHSHKQRLKDMKAMVRDPTMVARARRQEAKSDAVISIKLGGSGADEGADSGAGTGGFKKGGFRKGGFKSAFVAATDENNSTSAEKKAASEMGVPVISLPAGTSSGTPSSNNPAHAVSTLPRPLPLVSAGRDPFEESDTDDEGYEMYDPRHPTD